MYIPKGQIAGSRNRMQKCHKTVEIKEDTLKEAENTEN